MPDYLFDIRLNASVRLNAEVSVDQARAMLKAALDCADVNAGAWPDGSPILFEASLDDDDCSDEDAMVLVEVDGEDPEAIDLPPPPVWAAPVTAQTLAEQGVPMFKAHAIRAALAQERAAQLFPAHSGYEPDNPGIGDDLAQARAAAARAVAASDVAEVADALANALREFHFSSCATDYRFAGRSYIGQRHAGKILGLLMWNDDVGEGDVVLHKDFNPDELEYVAVMDALEDWHGLLHRETAATNEAQRKAWTDRAIAKANAEAAGSPETPEDSTDV